MSKGILAVVLAAGEGTRMKSERPKVLHTIAHRSMLGHVLTTAQDVGASHLAVVIGPDREDVAAEIRSLSPEAEIYQQQQRLGTAHAVLAARQSFRPDLDVLILYGDTPLIRPRTLQSLVACLDHDTGIAVLGFEAHTPAGYGRLLMQDGHLEAIREEKDASSQEKAVRLCNSGFIALRGDVALALLESIGNDNASGEYYLTDVVGLARQRGLKVAVRLADEDEVRGVNTRVQLAEAEKLMQTRLRDQLMLGGATLIAPETIFVAADTRLGRDVTVHPHVVFGSGVSVGDQVDIRSFSHLEQTEVAAGATIGPFARLRPGASIGAHAHVGNFVEIKASRIEEGAKINHLSYIGDSQVGAGANVGAGTITCNYDGFLKHRTNIGAGAFIGSNSSLVAPVTIGAGAYVGSGSVITDDVPEDALAIGRGRQVSKAGRALELKRRLKAIKDSRRG